MKDKDVHIGRAYLVRYSRGHVSVPALTRRIKERGRPVKVQVVGGLVGELGNPVHKKSP